jgi:hypothetical protein
VKLLEIPPGSVAEHGICPPGCPFNFTTLLIRHLDGSFEGHPWPLPEGPTGEWRLVGTGLSAEDIETILAVRAKWAEGGPEPRIAPNYAARLICQVREHERAAAEKLTELARFGWHLSSEVAELRRQLENQRANNEQRNRQLDALGIVWCSGGCEGGMLRYHPDREVTAQMVADLIVNARRAVAWYVNRAGKGTGLRIEQLQAVWQRAREEIRALLPPLYRDDEAVADPPQKDS